MPIVACSRPRGDVNRAGSPLAKAESRADEEKRAEGVEGKSAWMRPMAELPPSEASSPPERSPSPMVPLPRMV